MIHVILACLCAAIVAFEVSLYLRGEFDGLALAVLILGSAGAGWQLAFAFLMPKVRRLLAARR